MKNCAKNATHGPLGDTKDGRMQTAFWPRMARIFTNRIQRRTNISYWFGTASADFDFVFSFVFIRAIRGSRSLLSLSSVQTFVDSGYFSECSFLWKEVRIFEGRRTVSRQRTFGTIPPKRSLGETMRSVARRVRHPQGCEFVNGFLTTNDTNFHE